MIPAGIYTAQKEGERDYRIISGDWRGYTFEGTNILGDNNKDGDYVEIVITSGADGAKVVQEVKALRIVPDIEKRRA
jgi:hypothetical protein